MLTVRHVLLVLCALVVAPNALGAPGAGYPSRPLVQLVEGVSVVRAACPGLVPENSCYMPGEKTIYLARGWNADTYYHEYGHAWDFLRFTDADRQRFQRLMHFPSSLGWDQEPRYRLSPQEEFANAYADCALGAKRRIRKLCAELPRSAFSAWRNTQRHG